MTSASHVQDNTRVCNIRINKADELANPALRVLHSHGEKLHRYEDIPLLFIRLSCVSVFCRCTAIVFLSSSSVTWWPGVQVDFTTSGWP